MQGGRKLSRWNLFVKKVYSEGKSSNKSYSFKQALSDASRRKGEMGNAAAAGVSKSKKHKTRKGKHAKGGTRRRHRN